MKRILWTCVAVATSTAVYFTIRYGLRPKPIPVMNPTEFENLEQLGAVTYKRLRQTVRAERLVMIGSGPEAPAETGLWRGFLKSAVADHEKIVLFTRRATELARPGDEWETAPVGDEDSSNGEFARRVTERTRAGQLVIVLGRTDEVTHLVKGSLGRVVETIVQHPVLSISTLPFAVDQHAREELSPACVETGEASDGARPLACAAGRVARKFARKQLAVDKIWAVIERHGLKEYLVFLHLP